MIDFKKINNLDICNEIEKFGYFQEKSKSTLKNPVYVLNDDEIVVDKRKNMYFNRKNSEDKGGVLDFVIIRLTNSTKKNFSKDVLEKLKNHFNSGSLIPHNSNSESIEKPIFDLSKMKIDLFKNIDSKFLNENRKISLDTINYFKNDILVSEYEGNRNTAFLYKNEKNETTALQIKYQSSDKTKTIFTTGSELKNSFWKGGKKSSNTIILTEDPIDALSYHQIKNTDALYLSIGGSLKQGQIEYIKKEYLNNKNIVFAFDNDITGMSYTLKILFNIMGCFDLKTIDTKNEVLIISAGNKELSLNKDNTINFVKNKIHKSNITLDVPKTKDWNDDIKESITKKKRINFK